MAVTLEDIAKRAGVAKSTVSVTVRNHPRAQQISAETQERVMNAARELGYRPNFFASQLRRNDRRLVMFCVGYLQDAYSAAIGEAFERRLSSRDYRMLLSVLHGDIGLSAFGYEVLGSHGVTGMVVVGDSANELSDQAVIALAEEGVHLVLVGRDVSHPKISRVLVDCHSGVKQGVQYLHEQGVRNLWILAGPEKPKSGSVFLHRASNIQKCAMGSGMSAPRMIYCDQSPEDGYKAIAALLAEAGPPDAVFATADKLAYGAIRALAEAGYCVGKDVAVIGYDDIWPSATMCPPLATVHQPMTEMGSLAADMLIDVMEQRIRPGRVVTLSTELVKRHSGVYQQSSIARSVNS